jgi:regulator of nonsense transcripts 2
MDIDFLVQDAFMLTRPQWKLLTNLEDAAHAFAEAVKQNYQTSSVDKPTEVDEGDEGSASEDDGDVADDEDVQVPDADDDKSSGEEADASFPCHTW